jgi:hypothetical protein
VALGRYRSSYDYKVVVDLKDRSLSHLLLFRVSTETVATNLVQHPGGVPGGARFQTTHIRPRNLRERERLYCHLCGRPIDGRAGP